MNYVFEEASLDDLPVICQLFEEAIGFQKANHYLGWNTYDEAYIKTDFQNKSLFKIIKETHIIGIFSICLTDPLIWREMERGDAMYLHRIILNRRFAGEKIFQRILGWAIQSCNRNGLRNIRMDTWAGNEKLINYYRSYGFKFIENYTTPDNENLPLQHRNLNVALLELKLRESATLLQAGISLEKVNLTQQFSLINQYWSQNIIGQANGQLIKLAKGVGEINWHKHDDQDELFLLFRGRLTIQLRDRNIDLFQNELFIVPRGIEHRPKANGEVEFLIMGLSITSNPQGGKPDNWSS